MKFLSKFKKMVLEGDLFSSSEIIKYNSETTYKTFSGALFSLVIIAAIIFGFSSMIINTMEKTKLTSTLEIQKQSEFPPTLTLKTGHNHFMFGVLIQSMDKNLTIFDLTQGRQVFDLDSIQLQYENGVAKKFTRLSMVPCTRQHWAMMPELIEQFEAKNVNKWMCPPLNTPVILDGHPTSKTYKVLSLKVESCKNSSFNNNKCATKEIIDATFLNYTNFFLKVNVVNPVINPNQPEHIKYYLQEQNRVIFSKLSGVQMNVQFSDYTIDTDDSLLPYPSIHSESGYIIEQKAHSYPYSIATGFILVNVVFTKSPNRLSYTRQVLKISEVFSYIGGLIGAVTAFLFMFKSYTETALEINICLDLFRQKPTSDELPYKSNRFSFSFVNYVSFNLYKLLKLIDRGDSFIISKKMEMYQDEIEKQLDIKVLLQRLIKLESCMSHLFDSDQIEGIKNSEEITYQRAVYLRTLLHKNEESQGQVDIEKGDGEKNEDKQEKGGQAEGQSSAMGVLPFSPNQIMRENQSQLESQVNSQRNNDFKKSMKSIKVLREKAGKSEVKTKILKDLRAEIKKTLEIVDVEHENF